MKIFRSLAGITLLVLCGCNGPRHEDAIRSRLNTFFHHFQEMDLDNMIEYYHPDVFELTSRESILQEMKKELTGKWDLFKIKDPVVDSLFPVFKMNERSYAKIRYSFILLLDLGVTPGKAIAGKMTDSSIRHNIDGAYPAPQATIRRTLIWGNEPNMEELGRDPVSGWTKFRVSRQLVAIHDGHWKKWFFINLDEDPNPTKLLDKKALARLAMYK